MRAQVARFDRESRRALATACFSAGTGIGALAAGRAAAGTVHASPIGSTSRYDRRTIPFKLERTREKNLNENKQT